MICRHSLHSPGHNDWDRPSPPLPPPPPHHEKSAGLERLYLYCSFRQLEILAAFLLLWGGGGLALTVDCIVMQRGKV
jgi:hypothetical protein